MNKVIEATNARKVFSDGAGNDLVVLEKIDFAVYSGVNVSIVGASGSGKSTLLSLFGGLDKPSQGEIYFQGENIHQFASNKLAAWRNTHIGFIFQFHHLLPDFTALENVQIPSLIAGESPSIATKKAMELLEQVGLKHRLDHKPSMLSGGEQQRVAIARALINHPTIILADEPTGNLDEETANKVGDLLIHVCKQHKTTLILVTHNPAFAEKMEQTYRLSNGHIYADESSL